MASIEELRLMRKNAQRSLNAYRQLEPGIIDLPSRDEVQFLDSDEFDNVDVTRYPGEQTDEYLQRLEDSKLNNPDTIEKRRVRMNQVNMNLLQKITTLTKSGTLAEAVINSSGFTLEDKVYVLNAWSDFVAKLRKTMPKQITTASFIRFARKYVEDSMPKGQVQYYDQLIPAVREDDFSENNYNESDEYEQTNDVSSNDEPINNSSDVPSTPAVEIDDSPQPRLISVLPLADGVTIKLFLKLNAVETDSTRNMFLAIDNGTVLAELNNKDWNAAFKKQIFDETGIKLASFKALKEHLYQTRNNISEVW